MSSNIQPITFAYTLGDWQEFQFQFPEGATQTYPIGAPLKFSSGTVVVVSSVTAPTIAGIACFKATGTTGSVSNTNATVWVPAQQVVFKVSVDTTTTNNTAALGTGTPANFSIGGTYQMLLDSTSGNYYMGTGTSNAVFQYLGVDPYYATTINAMVYARILTSQTAWT